MSVGLHPFYEYGAWVRAAILVLAATAGGWRRYARLTRVLVDRSHERRKLLPKPESSDARRLVVGKEIAFEGTLKGDAVWTDDGVEIVLDGPRKVIVGSYESISDKREILAGARVYVFGELKRSEAAGYRDHKATWSLVGCRDEHAIWIAAVANPKLFGFVWTALRGALTGAVPGLLMLALVGAVFVMPANSTNDVVDDGRSMSLMAIGAVTPMRTRALINEANIILASVAEDDGMSLERALRLFELAGDEASAARVRAALCEAEPPIPRLEDAPDRYARCNAPMPPDTLFALGRFDEASHASTAEEEHHAKNRAHLLRMAEAHLVAHRWAASGSAILDYARSSGDADADRQEVLKCLATTVASRAGDRQVALDSRRAACTVLVADLVPVGLRGAQLGDGSFVWGDAQGMEFAKLLVNRISQALLAEEHSTALAPGVLAYALYPNAYLASTRPTDEQPLELQHFDMGNDVAHMEWYERTHLEEHPYAMWNEIANAPDHQTDAADIRLHAAAHTALLLAVTGDGAEARRLAKGVADIPSAHLNYWTRPSNDELVTNVERLLEGERPYRFRGALFSALTDALDRHAPRTEVASFTHALLDREICVPLLLLEAFARR